jgi:hypothetical protein
MVLGAYCGNDRPADRPLSPEQTKAGARYKMAAAGVGMWR